MDEAMRLPILAAAALLALTSRPEAAAAQVMSRTCVLHESAADESAGQSVRTYLEQRPGTAVMACRGDQDVTYQAMTPVRVEAPGVCRLGVRRLSEAALAGPDDPQAAAFEFMAVPEAGECPARGKGRWTTVTAVTPDEFVRVHRFASDLVRSGRRSTAKDRGCRKREDKLRALAAAHTLISVRREAEGGYALQLIRSGMGYTVSLELTADGACVRGYGQFII
jgi:hypothetical protein